MGKGSRTSVSRRTLSTAAAAFGLSFILGSGWVLRHHTSQRVQRWRPGAGVVQRHGMLGARVFGQGETVLVLLPGIAASQTFYGAAYDRLGAIATVVVIDPLGFGSSMDDATDPGTFGLTRHAEALSRTLAELGLDQRPLIVAGHSMGASLALQWAATLDQDVREIIAFDAPLYSSRREATNRVRHMGWFEAFLSSGPLARAVCWWMCRHRTMASAVAVLNNPSIPAPIARDGVKHTWFSYIQSFDELIGGDTWRGAFATLHARGVPVALVDGAWDRVPVPGRADFLAGSYDNVTAAVHPGGHDLPLSSPEWCTDFIYRRIVQRELKMSASKQSRSV